MPKRGPGRPIVEVISAPQARLLNEIESYIEQHGMSPTLQEMASQLGQSAVSIYKLIERLERKGHVSRVAGKARSLTVIRSANERSFTGLVAVPLLGTVAAGNPLVAVENFLGELLVSATTVRAGPHFALVVSGPSMKDAGIQSGDIVIVRQQQLANHRDIVVALLNDEATVKRLHHRDGEIALLPENPLFKPIPVGPEDDFRIVGKVVDVVPAATKKTV